MAPYTDQRIKIVFDFGHPVCMSHLFKTQVVIEARDTYDDGAAVHGKLQPPVVTAYASTPPNIRLLNHTGLNIPWTATKQNN